MRKSTLFFLCGKMASGKSTLSKKLSVEYDAILLSEDAMLSVLYPSEITTIEAYVRYSSRLKEVLKDPIISLLKNGNSVVLDFPANTKKQRSWFREIFESADVAHTLHFIDREDAVCKAQLKERNKTLPKGAPMKSEETFDAITKYFEIPQKEEGFNVVKG